jgi:hypothetical protein
LKFESHNKRCWIYLFVIVKDFYTDELFSIAGELLPTYSLKRMQAFSTQKNIYQLFKQHRRYRFVFRSWHVSCDYVLQKYYKGGNLMKKLILKILFLTLVVFAPVSALAGVSVHIDIPLPPPIIFPAPPVPVVIPETDVYTVPDVQEDIFFYGGWWWRPWEGRWYRSHYYDRGWGYYRGVPSFHGNVPPGWRDNYRNKQWKGHPWQQQRVPHQELQRNWHGWEKNRHWERQNSWGVQGLPQKRLPQRGMNGPHHQQGDQQYEQGGSNQGPVHSR